MEELALASKGCSVSFASSSYGDASKIIDGQRSTYWCSTGLYPQVFVLSFPAPVPISSVKIRSYLVERIAIEKSSAETTQQFENLCETELGLTDHCHQTETLHDTKFRARHLRFTIKSGYDHICAVYRVEVQGVQGRSGESIVEIPENDETAELSNVTQVLNPFQTKRSEGLGRTLGQSPRERGTRISSSVVPPLWNEEDEEEAEGITTPLETVTRMLPQESDPSSEEEAH
ncbi:intraflagellar transport protein 25 homolog [Periplaneta americana]|uniref:intraflagellar transport protein 25 homolog n=1 Tax=Periplaneta americana TaxID=6978 RepID=UPI0037E8E813